MHDASFAQVNHNSAMLIKDKWIRTVDTAHYCNKRERLLLLVFRLLPQTCHSVPRNDET